jgi:hypothetical protein
MSFFLLDIYIGLHVLAVSSVMRLKSMSVRKRLSRFALVPIEQVVIPC